MRKQTNPLVIRIQLPQPGVHPWLNFIPTAWIRLKALSKPSRRVVAGVLKMALSSVFIRVHPWLTTPPSVSTAGFRIKNRGRQPADAGGTAPKSYRSW